MLNENAGEGREVSFFEAKEQGEGQIEEGACLHDAENHSEQNKDGEETIQEAETLEER